jgi:RNA polymerase sigma-70 factor (ECF subfamily)
VNTDFPPHDPRAEELIAIRCQLGERDAFDALIARWHEPLWRYLRRMAGNDDAAADLVQDTWIRVLRGITGLRQPASLRPWLFGIARRVAMDRLRSAYAHPPSEDVELDDLPADADLQIEEDLAILDAAMWTLPLADREVLTLFYLRELSIDEIAALLEIPVGTVKSRLFRARRALRIEIAKSGGRQ